MHITVKNISVWDERRKQHRLVEVDLDMNEFTLAASLARRAADTRSGQAAIGGGAVRATIRGWIDAQNR